MKLKTGLFRGRFLRAMQIFNLLDYSAKKSQPEYTDNYGSAAKYYGSNTGALASQYAEYQPDNGYGDDKPVHPAQQWDKCNGYHKQAHNADENA